MEHKKLNLTLKVWRQHGPKTPGCFVTYPIAVSPDTSFLEMMDEINNELEKKEIKLKEMVTGTETTITFEHLISALKTIMQQG